MIQTNFLTTHFIPFLLWIAIEPCFHPQRLGLFGQQYHMNWEGSIQLQLHFDRPKGHPQHPSLSLGRKFHPFFQQMDLAKTGPALLLHSPLNMDSRITAEEKAQRRTVPGKCWKAHGPFTWITTFLLPWLWPTLKHWKDLAPSVSSARFNQKGNNRWPPQVISPWGGMQMKSYLLQLWEDVNAWGPPEVLQLQTTPVTVLANLHKWNKHFWYRNLDQTPLKSREACLQLGIFSF